MSCKGLQFPIENLSKRIDNDKYFSTTQMQKMSEKIESFFLSMNLPVKVIDAKFNNIAIVFTLDYKETEGKTPIRIEKRLQEIKKLQKDIELCLCSPVEIAGDAYTIRLAVKSFTRRSVLLSDLFQSGNFLTSDSPLTIAGGVNISGGQFLFNLEELGNLLVVGVTGSGKSTFLNDIILSVLAKATPEQAQFVLMDFKGVELQHFEGIPHMYYEHTIKQPDQALKILDDLQKISRDREMMLSGKSIYRFSDYPQSNSNLPRILIVIDEFIELYQKLLDIYSIKEANRLWKEVLTNLEKISAKTVQTGIHLVLVAQTPVAYEPDEKKDQNHEWDIIDALRFVRNRACLVATSQEELKRIVNTTFTDRLLGEGDMYFYKGFEDRGTHIQTAKVEPEDVDNVVKFIREKYSF